MASEIGRDGALHLDIRPGLAQESHVPSLISKPDKPLRPWAALRPGAATQTLLNMRTSNRFSTFATSALALVAATALQAGEITGFSWYSGVASLASTSISPLGAPNNDDVTGPSTNTVFVTQKNYIAIGPVDIVFSVINSGGVSEYLFTEGVFNNTTLPWGSYHIELGFGHDAGFVKSLAGDGLDFDAPNFNSPFNFNPSPGFFPSVSVTEDDVLASGGVMPYLSFAGYFRFTVDVPDGITEFTVRQSPIAVPEPGSLALSICGLAGLAVWRQRRKIARAE